MTDLEKALAAGAKPVQSDLERAMAAGAAPVADDAATPAPAPPQPQESPWTLKRVEAAVAQPFVDIGRGVLKANTAVAHAIAHPIDTARSIAANPAAAVRETMRGVNDNIPFANKLVAALPGGAPEASPEDEAAFPNARAVGGVVGSVPAGEALGGIASKVVSATAPAVGRAAQSLGEGAEARQIARTKAALELKVNKGTRAGLRGDAVDATIAESPELRRAAGNDERTAKFTASLKEKAGGDLAPIYKGAGPADEAVATAVANIDKRIAALKGGDVNAAAAAKKLQALRDEFNTRLGERPSVTASDLRAEQSAYQKNGYAKNIAGDPEVSASILAQREMSKAVGDALVQHVTGMDYAAAKAAAAADPKSLAARLFNANRRIEAAHRIDASIADRASRPAPKHGLLKVAAEIKHSPLGFVASKVPEAAAAAGRVADNAVAATAPRVASAAEAVGRAAGPTPLQMVQKAAQAGNQRAIRLLTMARGAGAAAPSPGASPLGTATASTLGAAQ